MGAHALYAAAFEPQRLNLVLGSLPASYRAEPDYLNVSTVTDLDRVRMLGGTAHELVEAR